MTSTRKLGYPGSLIAVGTWWHELKGYLKTFDLFTRVVFKYESLLSLSVEVA